MNITKQQWTIIGVIVAVIAVWYFFLRKKKAESNYKMPFRGNYSVPSGPATPPIPPSIDPKFELQKAQCKIGSCYLAAIGFPKDGVQSAGSLNGPSGINAKQWWLFKNCLKRENVG